VTAYPPGAYNPQQQQRIPLVRIIIAAVLVGVVAVGAFLAGRAVSGDDSGSDDPQNSGSALASPYGPKEFTDGIPHGYTHDKGGAAAAALNALAANGLVQNGTITRDAAIAALTASDATQAATLALYANVGGSAAPSVRSPLAVLSNDAGADRAAVRTWSVNVYSKAGVGPNADPRVTMSSTYTSATLVMVWQSGDWKVQDVQNVQSGPQPAEITVRDAYTWIGDQWVLYTGAN